MNSICLTTEDSAVTEENKYESVFIAIGIYNLLFIPHELTNILHHRHYISLVGQQGKTIECSSLAQLFAFILRYEYIATTIAFMVE